MLNNLFQIDLIVYSFEVSDVGVSAGQQVYLRNPKTGNKVKFTLFKTDKDSTGEDTYGWWYQSENGNFKLLIVTAPPTKVGGFHEPSPVSRLAAGHRSLNRLQPESEYL